MQALYSNRLDSLPQSLEDRPKAAAAEQHSGPICIHSDFHVLWLYFPACHTRGAGRASAAAARAACKPELAGSKLPPPQGNTQPGQLLALALLMSILPAVCGAAGWCWGAARRAADMKAIWLCSSFSQEALLLPRRQWASQGAQAVQRCTGLRDWRARAKHAGQRIGVLICTCSRC